MFAFSLEDCKLTDWRDCYARDAVKNADGMDISILYNLQKNEKIRQWKTTVSKSQSGKLLTCKHVSLSRLQYEYRNNKAEVTKSTRK